MALGIPNFSFRKQENSSLKTEQIEALKSEHAAILNSLMKLASEELNSGNSAFESRQNLQVRMEEIEKELAQNDVFIGHDAEAA